MKKIGEGLKTSNIASQSRIYRPSVSVDYTEKATRKIIDDVSRIIAERSAKAKAANDILNDILAPARDSLRRDEEASRRMSEYRVLKSATDPIQKRSALHKSEDSTLIQMLRVVPPDLTIFTPPWDSRWRVPNDSNAFVLSGLDDYDAMSLECLGSVNERQGDAAAGYGVYIASPVERAVSIRPYVPCSFQYGFWASLFNSTSRGGYGVTVYDDALNIVPGTHQMPELWDRTATSDSPTEISGSDYLLNHLPNGEIAFTMNAGVVYQLWVWIWGHGDCSGVELSFFGNDYGSNCSFDVSSSMPFLFIR